jgi:hypothetical protein
MVWLGLCAGEVICACSGKICVKVLELVLEIYRIVRLRR